MYQRGGPSPLQTMGVWHRLQRTLKDLDLILSVVIV
jgi:hypothetical protein